MIDQNIKQQKIASVVIYIIGIALIIINSFRLVGGLLGLFYIIGKTTEDIMQILQIKPIFPKLIYFGAVSGFITVIIYIVVAVYLLRRRSWARRLLLWFIPFDIFLTITYLFLMDMLDKEAVRLMIINIFIWFILLNKNIKNLFKEDMERE